MGRGGTPGTVCVGEEEVDWDGNPGLGTPHNMRVQDKWVGDAAWRAGGWWAGGLDSCVPARSAKVASGLGDTQLVASPPRRPAVTARQPRVPRLVGVLRPRGGGVPAQLTLAGGARGHMPVRA